MKLRELWNNGSEFLATHKRENGRSDARILLMHLLQIDYTQFILRLEQEINLKLTESYERELTNLISGKPLQYILGEQEFMGLMFKVNNNVLIPRGDTEVLVNKTLELTSNFPSLNIVDVGTGSGIIAVTLAKKLPKAKITAIDISAKALKVAELNAQDNKVKNNINFIKGDLLSPLLNNKQQYQIIVSNPPYISTPEMKNLPQHVLNEPHLALEAGYDGLDYYKRLAQSAPLVLCNNGYLIVEIGSSQDKQVKKIFSNNGFIDIELFKDFANLPRVVVGKLKKTL
ncbi:peptide chain release factor N(5)-glutamine methyltransferase [Clostridium sp. 'deep sea']|uniref:peptide chain release factor N(5)-glutamine methyltransferase n=1 Tax=Clostridium sp. 'deep sea' TaxID=2779445 RepID=UPI0018965AAD|nr:peptide chain release factor N(5)-glutamine methyltransferase [Clostridium sp. 'deep sea']QOR34139.1 peptide chain release factor N(5)-glutamine methyltransferase [Clostridium sp. 'deep sea']